MKIELTNLTVGKWSKVNRTQLIEKLNELINKINAGIPCYGQLGHPENFDFIVNKLTHKITNIAMTGDIIDGDVTYLTKPDGKTLTEKATEAKNMIDSGFCKFGLRAVGKEKNGEINIDKILTCDIILKD